MKFNLSKLLIFTLIFITIALSVEILFGNIVDANTMIDPQIRFRRGELGNIHLGSEELIIIGVMIVPTLLIYIGIFLDMLKK